jgi:hypothetical protein
VGGFFSELLVRLRAFALYRANGCSGQPISGVYRYEHVVIGPANYSYAWVALVKEHCTAMALRESIPMPQRGSRNGGACGVWFSEPAKKEFGLNRPAPCSDVEEQQRDGLRRSSGIRQLRLGIDRDVFRALAALQAA